MADTADLAGGPEPTAKKGGRTKLLLMAAAIVLLLLAAGGGAAWWFGIFGAAQAGHQDEVGTGSAAAEDHAQGEPSAEAGNSEEPATHATGVAFVDLPDVVVNLHASSSRMRFLKLRISLEVASDHEAEQLRVLTPRVMDSFQLYLRALTADDVQGAAGMQRLKEEMLARVLRAVEPLQIADVLIKEMLVQ